MPARRLWIATLFVAVSVLFSCSNLVGSNDDDDDNPKKDDDNPIKIEGTASLDGRGMTINLAFCFEVPESEVEIVNVTGTIVVSNSKDKYVFDATGKYKRADGAFFLRAQGTADEMLISPTVLGISIGGAFSDTSSAIVSVYNEENPNQGLTFASYDLQAAAIGSTATAASGATTTTQTSDSYLLSAFHGLWSGDKYITYDPATGEEVSWEPKKNNFSFRGGTGFQSWIADEDSVSDCDLVRLESPWLGSQTDNGVLKPTLFQNIIIRKEGKYIRYRLKLKGQITENSFQLTPYSTSEGATSFDLEDEAAAATVRIGNYPLIFAGEFYNFDIGEAWMPDLTGTYELAEMETPMQFVFAENDGEYSVTYDGITWSVVDRDSLPTEKIDYNESESIGVPMVNHVLILQNPDTSKYSKMRVRVRNYDESQVLTIGIYGIDGTTEFNTIAEARDASGLAVSYGGSFE